MKVKKARNTYDFIIESSQKEFYSKGYKGARMQDIAALSEVSKSMLHYYFETKEILFLTIFEIALVQFTKPINEVLEYPSKRLSKKVKLANLEAVIKDLVANQMDVFIFLVGCIKQNYNLVEPLLQKYPIMINNIESNSSNSGNKEVSGKELIDMLSREFFPKLVYPYIKED